MSVCVTVSAFILLDPYFIKMLRTKTWVLAARTDPVCGRGAWYFLGAVRSQALRDEERRVIKLRN